MTTNHPSLAAGSWRLGLWFQGALALLLFACSRASLAAIPESETTRTAFLPAGICLLPLVLLGLRYWPAVAAALLGLAASTRLDTSSLPPAGAWAISLTLGLVSSAALLRPLLAGRALPHTPLRWLAFIPTVAVGPAFAAAAERLLSHWLHGNASWDAPSLWLSIGPGFAGTMLPLLGIGATLNTAATANRERRPAYFTLGIALVITAAALHFGPTTTGSLAAALLPVLLGLRLRPLGAGPAILAITLAALALGIGHPSARWPTGAPGWPVAAPFEVALALTFPILALACLRRPLRDQLAVPPPAPFRSIRQALPRAEFFVSVKLVTAGLAFTVIAGEWIRVREEREARAKVEVVAAQLVNAMQAEIGAILGTQQRLALRWQGWSPATNAAWFEDARQILEDLPLVHSIRFADRDGAVRQLDSPGNRPPASPVPPATTFPPVPADVLNATNIVILRHDPPSGADADFTSIAVVQRAGQPTGWVGFDFRFSDLLPALKARLPSLIGDYHLAILAGDRSVYDTGGPGPATIRRWTARREFQIEAPKWIAKVSPTESSTVLDRWRGSLFILLTGVAFSGLSGVLVFFHRVSRAEAANANEAQRIAGIGSWELDLLTRGEVWSDQLYRLLGHAPGEVEANHENFFRAIFPEDQAGARAAHQASVSGLPAADFTCRIRLPDGDTRHLRCSTRVFTNPTGAPRRIVGTVEDVSESTRQANELRRARDDAESANRAKGEFLSTMSHELRTPLNGILGMGDLLLRTPLESSQRELANTVVESGRSLLRILNDIIDYSRLESGRGEAALEDIEIREFSHELLETTLRETPAPKVVAGSVIAPEVPGRFVGNRRYLGIVLSHLLANGLKFTPCGTVILRVSLPRQLAGATVVRFSVTDTGIGIPAGKRHLLFRPFQQLDTSGARRYGGAGLGLALSQRIVHALGGHIHVESTAGSGSVFWFELPFTPAPNSTPPAVPVVPPQTAIGVATPQKAVRQFLEDLAHQLGARTFDPAATGPAAAETTGAGAPRFLIVDTLTPPADSGPPELPTGTAGMRIVRLATAGAAQGSPDDADVVHLAPPLHAAALASALRSAANSESNRCHHTAEAVAAPAGARVLLLETQPINRRLTLMGLSKLGCEVDNATNPAEAGELISRNAYDIVLLRLDDTEPGGPAMVAALRAAEGRRAVAPARRARFVALSESGNNSKTPDGIDAWLRIPFHLPELREALGGARTIAT